MEQRLNKLESRIDKIEEKVEKQGLEFAETRVYVKEIYKKLDDLQMNLATYSGKKDDKNNDRMAKIVERSIWAIVAIVGYLAGKGVVGG